MADLDDMRLAKLRQICERYEINTTNVGKLRQLENYEIILLCDDSGSMTAVNEDVVSPDPYAKKLTRWEELAKTITIILDTAAALDKDGTDIYFLNRGPVLGVRSATEVQELFKQNPQGYTPTLRRLKEILVNKEIAIRERKVLLILATDGQPTDDDGNDKPEEFIEWVKNMGPNLFLSVVSCTDDKPLIAYLDDLTKQHVPRVDVTDDYATERKAVKAARGQDFKFSFGDYVVKVMLGAIDPSLGDKGLTEPQDSCCNIL